MNVVKYLKEFGLEKLKEEFCIRVKEYPQEGLLVLNYDQIRSKPKNHPIVMECRGLILDMNFNVVSRAFTRFFNLGEIAEDDAKFDISRAICFEKIDGSLIKIYQHQGTWYCSTRGTAFAEAETPMGNTFKDLVYRALEVDSDGEFQILCNEMFDWRFTYIFEVTAQENRVVKVYDGTSLWYLGWVINENGQEIMAIPRLPPQVKMPEVYNFGDFAAIREASEKLTDLDEGYVCWDTSAKLRLKVKSPVYVAVHRLRGEGLSTKRVLELVTMQEQDEYLAYYPEEKHFFIPYVESYKAMLEDMQEIYEENKGIESQKEFALAVKDTVYSAVLFRARNHGTSVLDAFEAQDFNWKTKTLAAYKEKIYDNIV